MKKETAPAGHPAPVPEPAPVAETAPDSRTTDIVAGQGGVLTDDVGVITGELTLRTDLSGDKFTLRVQYKEAEEWYVVTGGRLTLADPADLDAVHKLAVGLLDRPGEV